MKFQRLFLVGALAFVCVSAFGCAEKRPDGFPELYPISIKILQEGKPLEGASVNLVAQDPQLVRWPAGGNTNADGVVELRTYGYEGAPAGTFKVLVMKTETLGEANSPEEAQRLMQEGKLGDFERFDLVDTRYRDQAQTPLSLEVKAGSNATQEFDVGAPIREPVRMPGT